MMANRRPTATSRLKTKASRTINTEHLALSAPIALHPNTLLTQSLIASTFPYSLRRQLVGRKNRPTKHFPVDALTGVVQMTVTREAD